MKIFANGKRRFYSFIEFFVIRLKNKGVKIWVNQVNQQMNQVNQQMNLVNQQMNQVNQQNEPSEVASKQSEPTRDSVKLWKQC